MTLDHGPQKVRWVRSGDQPLEEARVPTLRMAQKLKVDTMRRVRRSIPDTLRRNPLESLRDGRPLSGDKATVTIESSQILARGDDIFTAWEQLHAILSSRLGYKRGAVILKRSIDGRPLIFSHCRGGMDEGRFNLDMIRVNTVLTCASGIVHSVLQGGNSRVENDLELALDYAALDASVQSELCVPVISNGDVVGAINFESEHKNAFDLHDFALATSLSASTEGQLQAVRATGNLGLTGWV